MIGGASATALASLKEATMLAGIAFQIKDDLLDLTAGKGRPIGSDTLEGKRTLLAIHALEHAPRQDKLKLLDILNRPRQAKTEAEVQWVSDLYQRTEAIEYAQQICQYLAEQAKAHFMALPESPARERLLRITQYLVIRVR